MEVLRHATLSLARGSPFAQRTAGPRRFLVVGASLFLLAACSSAAPASPAVPTSAVTTAATPASAAAAASAPAASAPTVAGNLAVAVLSPFTGADAAIGANLMVGCKAGVLAVNQAGGVLGHQLQCQSVDTRGDPADAVPATRQMFASTPNLALVLGASSDEASAVVPILNANKMVVFSPTGQSEFDQSQFPYFFRLSPPDIEEATAMVAIAHFNYHYQKIALVFGNDIGSQTFVPPIEAAAKAAGMQVTINQALSLSASSFRTEVAQLLASHPDAMLTETLGPTAATYLSELKQQNGGTLLPIIGTSTLVTPPWFQDVSPAVGVQPLTKAFVTDSLHVILSGPGYDAFKAAVSAAEAGNTALSQYVTNPYIINFYDAVVLSALAMAQTNSTDPAVYRPAVVGIANGAAGATEVATYQQGIAAIKAGQKIRYVAGSGAIHFDQYNNNAGTYDIIAFKADGSTTVIGEVPSANIDALKGH